MKNYFLKSQLFLLAIVPTVVSCVNPAAAVKDQALEFQAKFPDHLQTLKRNDKDLHFAWSGDPKLRPLVFVHGSPGSWEGWAKFLLDPELQASFQVIAVDRPGYGQTSPGVAESSLENQATLITAVLESNQSKLPAILVGHSFGGPVIAKMAMMSPQKIAGLIFVASSVDPELEKTKWYQHLADTWPIRHLIPSKLRVCNEEIMPLKAELERMVSSWKQISAKTLIIHGEEDPLVPIENVDFLKQHLPTDLVIATKRIPGLNHFVPWKRPDLIQEAIFTLKGVLK